MPGSWFTADSPLPRRAPELLHDVLELALVDGAGLVLVQDLERLVDDRALLVEEDLT